MNNPPVLALKDVQTWDPLSAPNVQGHIRQDGAWKNLVPGRVPFDDPEHRECSMRKPHEMLLLCVFVVCLLIWHWSMFSILDHFSHKVSSIFCLTISSFCQWFLQVALIFNPFTLGIWYVLESKGWNCNKERFQKHLSEQTSIFKPKEYFPDPI